MEKKIKSDPSVFNGLNSLNRILEKKEKLKFLNIVIFAIVVAGFEVLTATFVMIFSKILYDPNSAEKYFKIIRYDINESDAVILSAVLLGIIFFLKNILAVLEIFYHNFSIQKICFNFKNKILSSYLFSNYEFHLKRNSAKNVEVLNFNIENTFTGGLIAFANILTELIILIFLIGIIIFMNPLMAIIILIFCILIGFILQKTFLPKFYFWGQDLLKSYDEIQEFLVQTFNVVKEIIIFQKQTFFLDNFKPFAKKMARSRAIITATNSIPRFFVEILFVWIFVFTIYFLSTRTINFLDIIGLLAAYLYAGFRIMPGLNRIIYQINYFKSVIPSIERVNEEFKITQQNKNLNISSQFLKFDKSIELNKVSFKYTKNEKPVFKNLNLKINKGDFIGLVGETGSGKTSLINLLVGLLKPNTGKLVIDKNSKFNSLSWMKRISYVSQNIFLLDESIESNIAFGDKQINKDKIKEVVQDSQLNSTIRKFRNGIKTNVGENGKNLSGGEKQRISIARALYLNREILIFDEATSALDRKTENTLIRSLKNKRKNITIIMISHRKETLKFCDKIYQIKNRRLKKIE